MADHLAATYLDRANDAERTILQLKLELQAARTEIEEAEDAAAAESFIIEGMRVGSAQAKQKQANLVAENAELKKKLDGLGAEKDMLEAENIALKKELGRVIIGKSRIGAALAELEEKLDRVGEERPMLEAESGEPKEGPEGVEVAAPTGTAMEERLRVAQEFRVSHDPFVPHPDDVRSAKEFLASFAAARKCLVLAEARNLQPFKAKSTTYRIVLSLDHRDDHATGDGELLEVRLVEVEDMTPFGCTDGRQTSQPWPTPPEPTYTDLITELQAARTELKEVKDAAAAEIKQVEEAAATEVKEVKDAAAAEIKQVKDAAAADKTAHTNKLVDTYSKEILRLCEAAQKNGEELMAENRALRKKVEELEGVAATTVKEEWNDGAPGSATTVKEEEDDGAAEDLDLLRRSVQSIARL
ncbi:hypothetical protein LTR56_019210 [Elasticomyces elasticus]|nr:hypothetical protein LTR56_019210 [Elasticomyces elasticus]KAK3633218.1 hypothetical protein LTR22_020218 [Elasticomyces elasticus]KAK4910623.1 hypothetical protein LTR49_020755 [Elasticomyces elasticus]KAK5751034.1 hypothetical protein LTS12_018935 [Elasticomyces elasticus]